MIAGFPTDQGRRLADGVEAFLAPDVFDVPVFEPLPEADARKAAHSGRALQQSDGAAQSRNSLVMPCGGARPMQHLRAPEASAREKSRGPRMNPIQPPEQNMAHMTCFRIFAFSSDAISIRPLRRGKAARERACPGRRRGRSIAARVASDLGPPVHRIPSESSFVWRQHVEDDPFGRSGRGPALAAARRGRSAARAQGQRRPRRAAAAPAEPAAAGCTPRRPPRPPPADEPPKSSTTPTASRRCGRAATSSRRITLGILAIMSMGSWYIIITKVYEQAKMGRQARAAEKTFWKAPSVQRGRRGPEEEQPVPLHRRDRARGDRASTPACSATST